MQRTHGGGASGLRKVCQLIRSAMYARASDKKGINQFIGSLWLGHRSTVMALVRALVGSVDKIAGEFEMVSSGIEDSQRRQSGFGAAKMLLRVVHEDRSSRPLQHG